MGFGWMFLGYLLLLGTNLEFFGIPVDITPDVLGYYLMLRGFRVASVHCDCFRVPRVLATAGIPVSLAVTALDLLINMKVLTLPLAVSSGLSFLYDAFMLAYSLVLLYSVYLISTQVGLDKLRKKALRFAIYTVVFFFLADIIAAVFPLFGATLSSQYVLAIDVLAEALCVVINSLILFDCYRMICLEGDEDMPDNREHKYKTPFDYFDRRRRLDEQEREKKKVHHHKKKR